MGNFGRDARGLSPGIQQCGLREVRLSQADGVTIYSPLVLMKMNRPYLSMR